MDLDEARQLLAGADLDIQDLVPMDGGAVHSIYELRAGDGQAYVLKLYRGELSWKLDKELHLYELVHSRTSIPIPEVVHAGPAVLVMAKSPGSPLRFLDVSDEEVLEYNRQLGALLRELHTITFNGFGYIETRVINPADSNLKYMRGRLDGKLRGFDRHGGNPALKQALERHFAAHERAFTGCETAVLCHNDAHDANLLVSEGRITGLVDWENAVAGDPLLDLAKADVFASRRSEATLAALIEGYGAVREDWREAFDLYVIDHLLELWLWFIHVDVQDPLEGLAADLEGLLDA